MRRNPVTDKGFTSMKEIIKRSLILWGIIFAIIGIVSGLNYYKRYVSWKSVFEITYIGAVQDIYGKSNGREYIIFNDSNDTYEITAIYIEVSDAHKTYKIPYETNIFLQPHETEDMTLLYSKIGDFFEKESYSCNPVIRGFEYKKK